MITIPDNQIDGLDHSQSTSRCRCTSLDEGSDAHRIGANCLQPSLRRHLYTSCPSLYFSGAVFIGDNGRFRPVHYVKIRVSWPLRYDSGLVASPSLSHLNTLSRPPSSPFLRCVISHFEGEEGKVRKRRNRTFPSLSILQYVVYCLIFYRKDILCIWIRPESSFFIA